MSSIYSCIDDGDFTGRLRPAQRPASLHRDAISRAQGRIHFAKPTPASQVNSWVDELDDGLLSPVATRHDHPGRTISSRKDTIQSRPGDANSSIISYVDDGGDLRAQFQDPQATQSSTQRRSSAPPLGRSSLAGIRVRKVEPVVPVVMNELCKGATLRRVPRVYHPELEKATLQDIRSTIKNIESFAATVVPPRSTKPPGVLQFRAPPAIPTFIINTTKSDSPVVVDGRGEPIRQQTISRTAPGQRKEDDEPFTLPEYPVFSNKARAVSRPARVKAKKEHEDALGPRCGGSSISPTVSTTPSEDQAWMSVGLGAPPAPDSADEWTSVREGPVEKLKHPKQQPSNVKMMEDMSKKGKKGRKGNQPSKRQLEFVLKAVENDNKDYNIGKKGKKGQKGMKFNEDKLETILEVVEKDNKAQNADSKTSFDVAEVAKMQAGDQCAQLSTYPQQQTIVGVTSMPYSNFPPHTLTHGFPSTNSMPLQVSSPDFKIPNQILYAGPQSAIQSNYKAPTVETVPSTPEKTKRTPAQGAEGSPRTPGGRRRNGYDDDEGYTNQVWAGIPVRVAEWKMTL